MRRLYGSPMLSWNRLDTDNVITWFVTTGVFVLLAWLGFPAPDEVKTAWYSLLAAVQVLVPFGRAVWRFLADNPDPKL